MKKNRSRRKHLQFEDVEFLEALREGDSRRHSPDRQSERKTRQFCRQVQLALNLALEDGGDAGIGGLFVDEVSPAPDCGRLLAHVAIPDGCAVADALSALRRDAARLRSEVAAAINRKRAPELDFAPAFPEEGGDE